MQILSRFFVRLESNYYNKVYVTKVLQNRKKAYDRAGYALLTFGSDLCADAGIFMLLLQNLSAYAIV